MKVLISTNHFHRNHNRRAQQIKMNVSSLTITSVILLACLIWMDACLYFQIQCIPDDDYYEHKQSSPNTVTNSSSYSNITSNAKQQQHGPYPATNKQHGISSVMNKFSFAFQGMSVKLMMTDPVDNYLLAPLSEAFADMVNFKDNLWFITPNMVSYAGVISALAAAKLVTYNSSTLHKLSYLLFQLRTWLDDLDGAVARSRLGIHKHVSLQKTSGYVVDGVCDAIGFVAYIIGCYIFLKNTIRRRGRKSRPVDRYNLQSITEIKSSSPSTYIPLQQDYDEDDCLKGHSEQPDSDRDFANTIEADEEDEEIHFNTLEGLARHENFAGNNDSELLNDKKPKGFQIITKRINNFARSIIYLEKVQKSGKQSNVVFYRYIKEKIKDNLSNNELVMVTVCFLLQIAMCATFWNRYILVYRDLLETASENPVQARMKSKIIKSNIMYVIIWFWRLTNGHSFMQMLIAAVFIGKLWKFLDFVKYIGFVVIIVLATITELHIIDVKNYLS